MFPEHTGTIERLRADDAAFEELCENLEALLGEMVFRFGSIDQTTTDLIASFDELRRDIERRLTHHSIQHANTGTFGNE